MPNDLNSSHEIEIVTNKLLYILRKLGIEQAHYLGNMDIWIYSMFVGHKGVKVLADAEE